MGKKHKGTPTQQKGNVRLRRTSLIIFFSVLVILILGSYLFIPQIKHTTFSKVPDNFSVGVVSEASSSAKPTIKPTPTPLPIPTHSGRSVKVPIIYYHYIGKNPNPSDKLRDNLSVDPDLFDGQMNYIATSGFNTITFDTLYAALKGTASLPPKPVLLTFDDGYIDFYVNAFPILRRYNLKATEFIPTGLIDTAYYLHWDQIKEMDKTGLISFEAHSVAHLNLVSVSGAELKNQLVASKQKLTQELGKPVNFMAYPYGTSNEITWQAAKDAGYFGAAGTWGGNIESEGNVYDMPRIKISGGITLEEFKRKIQ